MTNFLEAYTGAHNAGDVAGALTCFTEDIDYRDIFFGECHGHAALGAMLTRTFTETSAHRWTITRWLATPEAIVAEWSFDYTVSDAVAAGRGRRLVFPGVSWFEMRGERCFRYREFFDRTATLHAQGVAPDSVGKIVARRSEVRVAQPSPG